MRGSRVPPLHNFNCFKLHYKKELPNIFLGTPIPLKNGENSGCAHDKLKRKKKLHISNTYISNIF